MPYAVDIPAENTIIRLEANVYVEVCAGNTWKGIKYGGRDVGSKGRKNVKKPKKQIVEKKAEKTEQKKT